jgi:hypothetical protein
MFAQNSQDNLNVSVNKGIMNLRILQSSYSDFKENYLSLYFLHPFLEIIDY